MPQHDNQTYQQLKNAILQRRFANLNPMQRQAVMAVEGPVLILAGAGSGKTTVLIHRIANLLQYGLASARQDDMPPLTEEDWHTLELCAADGSYMERASWLIAHDVPAPWNILAITFTNKAAGELRARLAGMLGSCGEDVHAATFHAACSRILRAEIEVLGYSRNFTIYDTDDSVRVIKDAMAELHISDKNFAPKALLANISRAKDKMLTPEGLANSAGDNFALQVTAKVYRRYQEMLKAANALDFDDIILLTVRLFREYPEVLQKYQRRYRYIMVDEYQDTNHAQYAITGLLAQKYKNIMVVGDDDQSIYSWRGADIRNILEFEQDYPNCHTVKLEQNYRSVGNVLAAANAVIANNQHRKAKKLFTSAEDGEKIHVYMATDERDEGRWIAGEIEKRRSAGMSYNQIAVFYRTNAQSRMLEDMLLRAGVPYRIVGGTKFFDRAEIRDVMAYLTLVVNPADDIAAKRVINVPRRGIGKTTIERIEQFAREMGMTFMQGAELVVLDPELRASTRRAVGEFVELIKEAQEYSGELRRVVEMIVDRAGLISALTNENTDEARGRIENIQEFMGVVDEFSQTHEEDDAEFAAPTEGDAVAGDTEPVRVLRGDSLADFIEWVRLRTDLDTMGEDGKAVTLMTVHSSKGLEFDCVFTAGMEETLFPHMNSVNDAAGIEEERRLAYVAITRARKVLYLTCAQQRQIFGQTSANPVSRFIHEIPAELRQTSGLGSAGFSGTGWEKRGSRRGIAGSGTEAGGGRVFGRSSASGSAGRGDRDRAGRSGHTGLNAHGSGGYVNPKAGKKEAAGVTFAVGDAVDHKTFGRGKVVKVDGDTLHIRFAKTGQTKKLLKDYAPIVKIG